jgi:hypothetical protein
VHVLGFDCDEPWVLVGLALITIALKLYQNKVWADMAQAQRTALQLSINERGGEIRNLVKLEAISTTLGLASIILVLGSNAWVMLAIVIGNLFGVYFTYSHKTKDSHSTAHDLVEMLCKYDKGNDISCTDDKTAVQKAAARKTTAEFISLMRKLLNETNDSTNQANTNYTKYQRYTDREIKF